MNKFKMGTGENDQKKRKTSVSGKESKKPKLEKNLVKTQEVGGASSQNTQTSVSGKENKTPKTSPEKVEDKKVKSEEKKTKVSSPKEKTKVKKSAVKEEKFKPEPSSSKVKLKDSPKKDIKPPPIKNIETPKIGVNLPTTLTIEEIDEIIFKDFGKKQLLELTRTKVRQKKNSQKTNFKKFFRFPYATYNILVESKTGFCSEMHD